jgi:RHS repeat-associated protein
LDYSMNRYYSNAYGRFMTPDPRGRKAARRRNPQSWNLYAYAHGDPVNGNDPSGLCVVTPDGDWVDTSSEANPFEYLMYLQEGALDAGDGPCDVFYDDVDDIDTPWGSEYWSTQVIQAINATNPEGFLNAFMGYSVLAGVGSGLNLVEAAGAFAEGASAADTLLLGPGGYVDPVTGAVYSGYIDIGGVVGANTINIPADVWETMTLAQQQAALTGGIVQALNSGAQVAFTVNPATATGWTLFEYNYITQDLGYQVVQQGTSWVVVP